MNSRLRTIGNWLRGIILGLVGILLLVVIVFSIIYSPEYVFRVVRWRDADVYDYQKFPERVLEASPNPFHFEKDLDESRIQTYCENHPSVGDLDRFLEDTNTQALIVIQDDTVIYENYQTGTPT